MGQNNNFRRGETLMIPKGDTRNMVFGNKHVEAIK